MELIRPIRIYEIPAIQKLIHQEFLNKKMLNKSYKQLFIRLRNYLVIAKDGKIIGCIGYKALTPRLPEIISFVVAKEERGKGYGTKLISAIIQLIKDRGYGSVITLSATPKIFEKAGFKESSIKNFPDKIWQDCRLCPNNAGSPNDPRCNETCLFMEL